MNKTKIEWTDYTINPVKGKCPMACPFCYARRMYDRFKWNPKIRYKPIIADIESIKEPSRIFVGSTIELFGEWVKAPWLSAIFEACRLFPQHTFQFLTKQPQNLLKWSPFPDNCWIGVSVTKWEKFPDALYCLSKITSQIHFISFEPLLEFIPMDGLNLLNGGVDWVIIGAQTPHSYKTMPRWEWIREIINSCDEAKIPIFLKDNLKLPRYSEAGAFSFYKKDNSGTKILRQEFPIK